MEIDNLHDYVIDNFCHDTGNIKEIDHIPHFPEPKGTHKTIVLDKDEIHVEKIINSAFPNHILFKIPIDNMWVYQKPKVYNFLHWLFKNYKDRKIISVEFYQEIKDDPFKCLAYFMIEFAP